MIEVPYVSSNANKYNLFSNSTFSACHLQHGYPTSSLYDDNANIPLPADGGWSLCEPHPPFLAAGSSIVNESLRDSYVEATPYDSGTLLPVTKNENYTEEEPVVLAIIA